MYSNKKKYEYITFSCILLLVLMWSYASITKLTEYQRFVAQMQLVPLVWLQEIAPILAWLLPLVELGIVVLLWKENTRILGCYFSFFLLLAFELYIVILLASGLELPCTCGGIISKLSWKAHLFFNAVYIALSFIPIYLFKTHNDTPLRRIYS
ncbi:MauE/DoxX family redox-associated membrane protein [Pedobacter sp. UBA4863]|uniref:MauE/DoxX family redox-associated membrane protein n=1 Tax=Pedobacter sp. UBA4863 TaxID=1947060 RepID=UPI0025D2FA68|nr:MauE/DoxX family redox-associated membrane protein [Pedobacter sp. UBA4863]